jgi:hypothetical protein
MFLGSTAQRPGLAGRLQEVAVAGRALGVEAEVFDAPVLEEDDLDVLAAYVADDVHVREEVQSGLRVSHRLDDRGVGRKNILENVLGVAGHSEAADLQNRSLRGDLFFQVLEDGDGVLDGIAAGKLVGFGEDGPLGTGGHQNGFG